MNAVQNNMMALNASRTQSLNNLQLKSSLMKLASGSRINSAGDDPAGLGISERMRAEQTAVQRAMMNAQDGASLVQTADGALSTTHTILNRLNDLSMQASNGILNDRQRASINNEAQSLMQEMDRIAKSTDFNGIKILDGSLSSGADLHITGAATSQIADSLLVDKNSLTLFDGTNLDGAKFSINGHNFAIANESNYNALAAQAASEQVTLIGVSASSGGSLTPTDLGNIASTVNAQAGTNFEPVVGGFAAEVGRPLELQVGTGAGPENLIQVNVGSMTSQSLGLGSLNLTSQQGAQNALDSIRNAIDKVSSTRGDLGATQNRLGSAYNNLAVSYENTTRSESVLRDTDMAKEMMNTTKRSLLSQVSNSMMAQANMTQQMMLNLLR